MYTLGINGVFHDPAAALLNDGQLVAAAEEERFTRIKHGKRPVPFSTWELPYNAIDYCLKEAGIMLKDVDHVAYSFDPFILLNGYRHNATISLPLEPSAYAASDGWETPWDPLFVSYIINAPRQLADGAPHHLAKRFRGIRHNGPFKWHYVEHHIAHAASAFHASPFETAAVMTLDGRGEKATTLYATGEGNKLNVIGKVNMPHSLGMLYEEITDYLGFLRSSDEYKVMALASFGKPVYRDLLEQIVQVGENGQFTIRKVDYEEWFGPRRYKGESLDQRHFDIAHSLQVVLEDTVIELAEWLHKETGEENLTMAGGVALNVVVNARLRDRGPFKNIWVQPAAGDAGTALGAALWVDAKQRPQAPRMFCMDHALWGPEYSEAEIEKLLKWSKLPYRRSENLFEEVAEILAQDKVIGWMQGRLEFGPRALGARSILASPIHAEMQERLNEIKSREDFRPVAPVVLEEDAEEWFVGASKSPFMLFIFDVKPEKADMIPAVRHVDGTARIQTINRGQNAPYYDLLKAFKAKTGIPVLVNTSFNTLGEPIVNSPRDAIECFFSSPLDALVIGPFIVEKPEKAA